MVFFRRSSRKTFRIMGLGSFPNDTFGAAGKKIGVGNASEPVRSGQYVDAMVCDQAAMISIPNIDSSTADVEVLRKISADFLDNSVFAILALHFQVSLRTICDSRIPEISGRHSARI